MVQSTATFPNIVQRLDKLNILLFWEILKTKNPLLLDGDYMPDKVYTEEEEKHIVHVWEIMYDSYFQLKNDSKSKMVLHQAYELMLLSYKIWQLTKTTDLARHLEDLKHLLTNEEYIEKEQQVYSWFKIIEPELNLQYFKGMETNLEIVGKRIQALQNKYNRENKSNEANIEKQVDNVFSVIVKVSQTVGHQLNAEKMMVTEWLAWEKAAKDKIQAQHEASRKKK